MGTVSGTNPPLQERSRKTFEDLLAAGVRLLETRLFADVTVQDIVTEAASSAGSFYARFDDKTAFLHAMQIQMCEQEIQTVLAVVKDFEDRSVSVDDVSKMLTTGLVQSHRKHRGLLRSILTVAASEPELGERAGDLVAFSARACARITDAPGRTVTEIFEELCTGQLVVLAILDQHGFYSGISRTACDAPGMGTNDEVSRLDRILRASMDL